MKRMIVLFIALLMLSLSTNSIAGGRRSTGGSRSSHKGKTTHVSSHTKKNGISVRSYNHHSKSTGSYSTKIRASTHHSKSTTLYSVVSKDSNGHNKRSESAKRAFMKQTGYPHGRPGYVIDHIKPLALGGADSPSNMQWQTKEDAKAKDKWERGTGHKKKK